MPEKKRNIENINLSDEVDHLSMKTKKTITTSQLQDSCEKRKSSSIEKIRKSRNEIQKNYRESKKLKLNTQKSIVSLPSIAKDKIIHESNSNENYLRNMNYYCNHCQAKNFKDERVSGKQNSFNDCCGHGIVILQLVQYPEDLRILLEGLHTKSGHFKKNIRHYNNSFSFASLNANVINFNNVRRPFCYKIQGQIYYQINTVLYPDKGEDPCFGQLFIYDPEEAIHYRLKSNKNLDKELLQTIENIMRTSNTYTKSFMMMSGVIKLETDLAKQNNEEIPELQLLFTLKKGFNKKRYNF